MKHGVLYYFSGTGNTKLACEYIRNNLSDVTIDLFDITQNAKLNMDDYDFAGFATFTDWGDPPYLVQDFINKLNRQNNKPAFIFNTCAGFSGKTLRTLKRKVEGKGFKVVACFTLKAPESYPPMVAKGRTKADYPSPGDINDFKAFISDLNYKFSSGNDLAEAKPKLGLLSVLIPAFPRDRSKKAMGSKYVDEVLCSKCGKCEQLCPYKAINMEDGPGFDESRCYGCWVCFNHCPRKAIYTGKLRGKGHYSILKDYHEKLMVKEG